MKNGKENNGGNKLRKGRGGGRRRKRWKRETQNEEIILFTYKITSPPNIKHKQQMPRGKVKPKNNYKKQLQLFWK